MNHVGDVASNAIRDMASGQSAASGCVPSDDGGELEDRQVHRDHQAADYHTEHHHDQRLKEARHRIHRVVDLGLVEGRDFAARCRR